MRTPLWASCCMLIVAAVSGTVAVAIMMGQSVPPHGVAFALTYVTAVCLCVGLSHWL